MSNEFFLKHSLTKSYEGLVSIYENAWAACCLSLVRMERKVNPGWLGILAFSHKNTSHNKDC